MESHRLPSVDAEAHLKAAPKTWGKCLEAILKNTELKIQVNFFTGKSASVCRVMRPCRPHFARIRFHGETRGHPGRHGSAGNGFSSGGGRCHRYQVTAQTFDLR